MDRRESFYLPQLDGLRFFAFLSVFVWHFMTPWTNEFVNDPRHSGLSKLFAQSVVIGSYGVDLFFVLSAYLITELLLRERRLRGKIDARAFYVRRALRIWPLFYAALIVILAGTWLIPSLGPARIYLPSFFFFLGNFALCKWGPPAMILAPLWSVSVEEQFYLVWPFVLRHLTRRRIVRAALVMWGLGIAFRVCMRGLGAPTNEIAYNTLARLDPIAIGILIAAWLDGRERIESRVRPWMVAAGGLIFCDLAFLAILADSWAAESLIALASGAFLVAVIGSGPHGVLSSRPLVYLGRISYGLYVFHGAIVAAGTALFGNVEGFSRWLLMADELGATIVIASISYRWMESPLLMLKRRFQHVASGAIYVPEAASHDTSPADSRASYAS